MLDTRPEEMMLVVVVLQFAFNHSVTSGLRILIHFKTV